MKIQPYLLGSGRAGQALVRGLALLESADPDLKFERTIALERGQSLKGLAKKGELSILMIANPHALHAAKIQEADGEFQLIVTEKPVCTSLAEIAQLRKVKTPVAVCHGYRQSWGIQSLRKMIAEGEFGDIVAVEGRYWQSSTAQRSLARSSAQSWKNDPKLSGPFDALVDIATHWVDAALFLLQEKASATEVWSSFALADAAHRDSHLHLTMKFPSQARALASISKIVHGAPNHFEINVIGTKKFATWKFLEFDQIEIGEGATRRFIARPGTEHGSKQPPFHGSGWLEGYVEVLRQSVRHALGQKHEKYPDLADGLQVMETLLNAKQDRS